MSNYRIFIDVEAKDETEAWEKVNLVIKDALNQHETVEGACFIEEVADPSDDYGDTDLDF